ncbi:MAG: glycosyltransferase [Gammaproteobacteria bacterium]
MTRRRLLVLASTYPRWRDDPEPGFVHELAKRLAGTFEVTVLGPHAPGAAARESLDGVDVVRYRYAPRRLETLVNDGGIVTNLKRQPWKWLLVPGFLFGLLGRTWRLVRVWRPHVIHAHWLLPQGLVVAMLARIDPAVPPFLVTSHGADLFALRSKSLQALKRFVLRRAAAVTVVSSAMRDELRHMGGDAGKVDVQPMGVDLGERFTPDARVARSHDELLFVGRLVEKKGLRHLIDAMPTILKTHPSAFLTVAGFGPEEDERRAQAARLGLHDKVRFLGAVRQEELPTLYRRAAVFVAPFVEAASGDREGFGLVTVEATGCGCPVVVSDLPAVRDVFAEGGVSLVRPGDPNALASACIEVFQAESAQSRERLERCCNRLLARFDWNSRASAYASLLRRLVP